MKKILAAGCAVTMQRRIAAGNQQAGERLGLRVGINAGEVVSDEDDYFGTPVVVARRLCDHASSGRVLCSEVVRTASCCSVMARTYSWKTICCARVAQTTSDSQRRWAAFQLARPA